MMNIYFSFRSDFIEICDLWISKEKKDSKFNYMWQICSPFFEKELAQKILLFDLIQSPSAFQASI